VTLRGDLLAGHPCCSSNHHLGVADGRQSQHPQPARSRVVAWSSRAARLEAATHHRREVRPRQGRPAGVAPCGECRHELPGKALRLPVPGQ
jgi:hypothetical protein